MNLRRLSPLALSSSILFASLGSLALVNQGAIAQTSLEPTEQLVAQQVAVLRSGRFVTVEQDHPTTGQARIVTQNGQRYLEFTSGFGTATGPDVQIVLHRKSNVPVNINEKDYITLAALKSFEGAQRYEIPDELDLKDFQSVAIWCRKFNVTFGYASL